jgi:hypothetical protein
LLCDAFSFVGDRGSLGVGRRQIGEAGFKPLNPFFVGSQGGELRSEIL